MDCSLRTVATLKELGVNEKIYARAIDQTHQSILKAMNIHRIFMPESYAARIFAVKFTDDSSDDLL